MDVWEWTPLIMLIAMVGLASLPKEPYESAKIDGASAFQCLDRITLPLLRPTLVVAILFRAIDALKTFDIIFVMTQGGPSNASETINILLFNQAFSYFNMGYASSMAVALFAIIMGICLILTKVAEGGDGRHTRAQKLLKTIGFYGLVTFFMLPMVFVFYWMVTLSLKPQIEAAAYPPIFFNFSITFKGYLEVFAKHPFLLYTWNSLVVAARDDAPGADRRAGPPPTVSPSGGSTSSRWPSWWPASSPGSAT